MSDDFGSCVQCGLKHRKRSDGRCPRCGATAAALSASVAPSATREWDDTAPTQPRRKARYFPRAIVVGVLFDVVGSVVVGAILLPRFALWASCGVGIVAGWIIGALARYHEIRNVVAGAVVAIGLAFVVAGIPKTAGDVVGFVSIGPLYLAGGAFARWRRKREDPALAQLVHDMDAYNSTVLGAAADTDAASAIADGAATGLAAGATGSRVSVSVPTSGPPRW